MIGLTMAAALLAQPPGRASHRGASTTPATPQQLVEREVNRLTHFLDLTTGQQTQVSGILSTDINNLQTLQGSRKTQREAVVAAIKTNKGVSTAVAALAGTQAQIETMRANEAALIYAVLTDDQKAKVGDALSMLSSNFGRGPGGRMRPPH